MRRTRSNYASSLSHTQATYYFLPKIDIISGLISFFTVRGDPPKTSPESRLFVREYQSENLAEQELIKFLRNPDNQRSVFYQIIAYENHVEKDITSGSIDAIINQMLNSANPSQQSEIRQNLKKYKELLLDERAYLYQLINHDVQYFTLSCIFKGAGLPGEYRLGNADLKEKAAAPNIKKFFNEKLGVAGKSEDEIAQAYLNLTKQDIRDFAIEFAQKYHPDLLPK